MSGGAGANAHFAVIGSGVAGAMVADRLLAGGHRVTMIERGPELSAEQRAAIEAAGGFAGAASPDFLRPATRGEPGRKAFARSLPSLAGGLAEFYHAVSLRFTAADFADWPIGIAEIEPFYAEAEAAMGVAIPRDLPLPLYTARIERAARELGMNPQLHPLAIDFATCRLCRNCNQVPCNYGARFSPARFGAERLLGRAGFARVRGEALRVEEDAAGARVIWGAGDGAEQSLACDGAVVCAGALETPALLARSGVSSPALGRYLMLHGLASVQGLFGAAVSRGRGFEKRLSITDFYEDEEGVRGVIQQDQLPAIERYQPKLPGWAWRLLDRAWDHMGKLMVIVADEPLRENRVYAGPDGAPVIEHRFSERDRARMDFLTARAAAILRKAGALWVQTVPGKSIFHACGSARMGLDPASSVVDPAGRVHGRRRLWVADGSTFCSSGGGNPSLTIAANARRIAAGVRVEAPAEAAA